VTQIITQNIEVKPQKVSTPNQSSKINNKKQQLSRNSLRANHSLKV